MIDPNHVVLSKSSSLDAKYLRWLINRLLPTCSDTVTQLESYLWPFHHCLRENSSNPRVDSLKHFVVTFSPRWWNSKPRSVAKKLTAQSANSSCLKATLLFLIGRSSSQVAALWIMASIPAGMWCVGKVGRLPTWMDTSGTSYFNWVL